MTFFSVAIEHKLPGLEIDIALEAKTGSLALFGPSGAGKTTILKIIAGLIKADRARVELGNELWDHGDSRIRKPAHKRGAVIVFQDDRLFPHLSVEENLAYGARGSLAGEIRQLTDLTGIGDLRNRSVHTLSGGERKRVAIARALAASPKLLLLDEPYAGLDRVSAARLRSALRELLHELATPHILVSHHLDDVLAHSQEVALIEDGKLCGLGTPEMVFNSADGQRLMGSADETFSGGPLTILRATTNQLDPDVTLASWQLENGVRLLMSADVGTPSNALIRIRGADVSLSLDQPGETSILNILPATVVRLQRTRGFMDVSLDLGAELLLTARITAYSAEQLGLRPGLQVFAMIKSVAIIV